MHFIKNEYQKWLKSVSILHFWPFFLLLISEKNSIFQVGNKKIKNMEGKHEEKGSCFIFDFGHNDLIRSCRLRTTDGRQ